MIYFDAVEFGKRLQKARKEAGMTQELFAEKIGVSSKKHISRIENGHSAPSLDLVVIISEVLNVSLDYLLKGCEPTTSPAKEHLLDVINQLANIVEEL